MWSQRVAASCVWLAGKLEESPRKSKHIIFVFHRMECRRENLPIEYLDVFSKVYSVQLNIILISFLLKPPCTFRLDIYGINLESLFFFLSHSYWLYPNMLLVYFFLKNPMIILTDWLTLTFTAEILRTEAWSDKDRTASVEGDGFYLPCRTPP